MRRSRTHSRWRRKKRAKEQSKADAGDADASAACARHNAGYWHAEVHGRERSEMTRLAAWSTAARTRHMRAVYLPAEQRVDNYITSLPREVRRFDAINTGDTGVVIPMNLVRVINTIRKRYGLYSRQFAFRLFPVRGGTASWITESTVAPRQDIGVEAVIFAYNMLEMRIAQTFLFYPLYRGI